MAKKKKTSKKATPTQRITPPHETAETKPNKITMEPKKLSPKETHDKWVKQMTTLGYTHALKTNHQLKTHALLVPFNSLPTKYKNAEHCKMP